MAEERYVIVTPPEGAPEGAITIEALARALDEVGCFYQSMWLTIVVPYIGFFFFFF
jgi:hypothetical protein